jgi:hypothetical protein
MNARSLAITRAVAVIGGTGALIVGATFAATNSTHMTGITFSASNDLQISKVTTGTPDTPTSYASDTIAGFPFGSNVHMGVQTTTPISFFLKSGVSLAGVTATGNIPSPITHTDANHIWVEICDHGENPATSAKCSVNTKLSQLSAGPLAGITTPGNAGNEYDAYMTVTANDGSSTVDGSATGFKLNFVGN